MRLLPIVTSLSIAMIGMQMVTDRGLSQPVTSSTTLSVTILGKSDFCGFPISVSGQYGDLTLRDVGIISICSNGFFVINVNSAKGGVMTSPGNSYSIPYKIKAAATGGASSGTDVIGNGWGLANTTLFTPPTTQTEIFNSKQGTKFQGNDCPVSCDIKIQWQMTSSSPVPAGTYTDTITYTLSNN